MDNLAIARMLREIADLLEIKSRCAAMQYFTGSKAHNIALRDRAIGLGFKLNEYGLFRIADQARVAGEREEEINTRPLDDFRAALGRHRRPS